MKIFLSILITACLGATGARAELPAGWGTNYTAAIFAMTAAQRPALIYFTATWCGPCQLMTRLTLTDPAVAQTLSAVQCVALDIDQHPDLATKYGVNAVPTLILLSTAQSEAERITGFQATGDFMHWLTNGIAQAAEAVIQADLCRKSLAEVDQMIAVPATNSVEQAALKLFDLADGRDPEFVRAVAERLQIIAAREPAALLDGLNDPHLATRIQVANALHHQLGDAFDVDPWTDPAIRKKGVQIWHEKLAKTSAVDKSR